MIPLFCDIRVLRSREHILPLHGVYQKKKPAAISHFIYLQGSNELIEHILPALAFHHTVTRIQYPVIQFACLCYEKSNRTLSHETSRDTGLITFNSARENTPRSFQIVLPPYRTQDSPIHTRDKQTKEHHAEKVFIPGSSHQRESGSHLFLPGREKQPLKISYSGTVSHEQSGDSWLATGQSDS